MEKPEEKKKVEQIVEKIPDKLLSPISEAQKKKGHEAQQFFQIALQRANIENKYQEVFAKLNNTGTSIGNKIKHAFDKMKLGKKKNIRWSYDGKDSFIGIPRPESKPKKDVK
jgi:hypothetical protein